MRNTGSILLAAALALPACAEAAPSDADYDAVAQLVAYETTTRARAFGDAVIVVEGGLPADLVRDDSGVVWGTRDGVTYHYWAGGSTVIAWWDGEVRSQGVWNVHGSETPMPRVAGYISLMHGAAGTITLDGDADFLVFVDRPSGLVLGGVIQEVLEASEGTGTYDIRSEVTFPSAGRAVLLLDDAHPYEIDLTPAPEILR